MKKVTASLFIGVLLFTGTLGLPLTTKAEVTNDVLQAQLDALLEQVALLQQLLALFQKIDELNAKLANIEAGQEEIKTTITQNTEPSYGSPVQQPTVSMEEKHKNAGPVIVNVELSKEEGSKDKLSIGTYGYYEDEKGLWEIVVSTGGQPSKTEECLQGVAWSSLRMCNATRTYDVSDGAGMVIEAWFNGKKFDTIEFSENALSSTESVSKDESMLVTN